MEHLRELIENKKYADFRKEIVDYNVQDGTNRTQKKTCGEDGRPMFGMKLL